MTSINRISRVCTQRSLTRTNFASRNFSVSSRKNATDVVILSAVRTPIGSFRSSLAALSATQLGSVAIKVCGKQNSKTGLYVDKYIVSHVETIL